MRNRLFFAAAVAAATMLAAGCGGGGGGSTPSVTTVPTPSPSTSPGVVYTGPDTGGNSSDPSVCRAYSPAPTITSVSPNSGALAGGTTVVIRGSGFSKCSPSIPTVTFGDIGEAKVVSYGDDQVTVIAPVSLATGVQDVRVTVVNPSFENPDTSLGKGARSDTVAVDEFTYR